jgi:hypothetical protein
MVLKRRERAWQCARQWNSEEKAAAEHATVQATTASSSWGFGIFPRNKGTFKIPIFPRGPYSQA